MSTSDNKLQRAHQLSAQGSTLARPVEADVATLRQALEAYSEAADLFDAASSTADDATRQTLRMLVLQHRKFVRDLERRIARLEAVPSSPTFANSPASASSPAQSQTRSASPLTGTTAGPSRASTGTPTLGARRMSGAAVGLNAGGAGTFGRPGLVHATSPPRSVPPFTLRPVGTAAAPPSTGPFGNPSSPRELYSSSSSSEPPDESFLLPGAVPETYDPFSRFWANLETMLDEISIPRALTMAPVEVLAGTPNTPARNQPAARSKSKGKSRADRSPSPSESFYVVPRGRPRDASDEPARSGTPSAKTNEELMLENESLRASLDALAKHTHQLELTNRSLTERAQERDKIVRSVVTEVKREAQKVRHDQDVIRSQILASTAALPPGQQSGPSVVALRKRIGELEGEVRLLRDDNGKLRAQVDKFKERWDKLKAKKEAKVAAAKARSPEPSAS